MLQERILEPLERDADIGLSLAHHLAKCEAWYDLVLVEVHQLPKHRAVGQYRSHRLIGLATLPQPLIGERGMAEIEDMQLQSLERLKVIDQSDGGVPERFGELSTADGPQRIGLGDRAHRLD